MSKEQDEKRATTADLKVLCPYCNAVWTAEMLADLESTTVYDTFGESAGPARGIIDIHCSKCGRLIYRKEINL